ncbi:MAG: alkaline phosphatase family protein [Rikenellaceae bacterium]|nr:alkaline phosphatase family protein [Rikenellaceae bacterium]
MKKIIWCLLATLVLLPQATNAQQELTKPRLVVNIVVSGLRSESLGRFGRNLGREGFHRFAVHGMTFDSAYYNYMQTLTPVSLATLTTGVNPSMHGVVADRWVDYTTGGQVSLIHDVAVRGLDRDPGSGCYSPLNIVMPTLGDKLLAESPASKVVTVAADPVSAVVMGGHSSQVFWIDEGRATWSSSTGYMSRLPEWVVQLNESRPANRFVGVGWSPLLSTKLYVNQINTIFGADRSQKIGSFRRAGVNDYRALVSSPWGNTLVADFVGQAVQNEALGTDEATDILNVCFDASRLVGQRYGVESMEYEDMIYRLDGDIAELVKTITARVGQGNVLFVVTSDHGTSDAWDGGGEPLERFNPNQFKTILNSFLGVQFGEGDWVLEYIDRQVYLNRNLIYLKNLSLEEVQNRAATFVLQFRGISHVLTSTAMQNGYFGASYGQRMQNGFYPRRAGDVMLNFMPGWIEERPDVRSLSGSMYDYDTHVPLMMFGWRIPPKHATEPVDMTWVAPTLAHILQISRPTASDGITIRELDHVIN